MELLTKSKSDYLLNGSIEILHRQSMEWLNEIDFWKDEIAFFYALTVKKTLNGFPDNLKSQENKIEKELIRISGGELDNLDRKSTRLNSSHLGISYAVFCLKTMK